MSAARSADAGKTPGAPRPPEPELSSDIYRAFFEAAPDGCIVVGPDGRIEEVNEEAARMFGWPREDLIGQSIELLVPERFREAHVAQREHFTADPARRPMGIGLELRARRRDGTEFPAEIGLGQIDRPSGRYVLAAVRDISERTRLREFGAGVLQGTEEERQRIARDLHDDTAQRLSSLLLRLQMARRTDDPERRETLLREMREEILRASEGVRRILRGLRPPVLDEAGFVAAVRAHARSVLADLDLDVEVEAADVEFVEARLDDRAKLALYRIVQEAISNVVRHAGASRVRITIGAGERLVRTVVSDDGRGFVPRPGVQDGAGLGILGMRERAALLGGRVQIESAPGEGTRVHVEVPVPD